MATNDDTPCVGSASEDIVEEKEEFKNKSWRTDGTLKVEDIVEEEAEEDIVEEEQEVEEEFKNKSWRTDVTLKVEDRLFYVSKHVLGAVSPVFEAMFDGENKDEDLSEIPLPGKKSIDVLEFLRCIYPNIMKPVTMENVFSVLSLAAEYQVKNLKKACESFLLKYLDQYISTRQLCTILNIAHTYMLYRVLDKGEQLAITRPRQDFEKSCNEVSLPSEIKSKILTKMLDSIETENRQLQNENNTARALCKYLGCIAKQNPLVDRFSEGKVTGKSFCFAVKPSSVDKKFDLDLFSFTFAVRFDQSFDFSYLGEFVRMSAFIKCGDLDKKSLTFLCVVILKNWMANKTDLVKENKLCLKKSDPSDKEMKVFETVASKSVFDESSGFIYKGVFNLEICLFIKH